MQDAWTHQLETWHEFYLLIGTAGVTLTGLLFVVVSLGPRVVASHRATGVRAFISPNAVYFATTLVVSAVLLVPNLSRTAIGVFLCLGAVASLGYLAYTKAHQQWRHGKLPFLDWVWFVGLPITSYVLLLLSGIGFLLEAALSMHAVAAALILLLVIGIRNAWDLVIWVSQREHGPGVDR
jgi:hypothetical protein